MAYDPSDPRAQLRSTPPTRGGAGGANVAPQAFEFDKMPPTDIEANGSRSWLVRSQAIVYNHIEGEPGDRFVRTSGGETAQPEEYMVLLPDDDSAVVLRAGDTHEKVTGRALVVMPPGDSTIEIEQPATVIRLFAAASTTDLAQRCANADFYAEADPNVAPWAPWSGPVDGHRIRVYPVDDVQPAEGRFGRIYRCSTFMVNWFYPDPGPRDPAKMSPHHHDDFEQLSLQLEGDYIHHIRTPWTVDMAQWREDAHLACASPSVTVIPPPSIHTSQSVGDTVHQLVDIFAPPRFDFSARPGWVLNADDYPVPEPSAVA